MFTGSNPVQGGLFGKRKTLAACGLASVLKMVGRTGFEPVKAKPADLQSAPFDRSGTYPKCYFTSGDADLLLADETRKVEKDEEYSTGFLRKC